MEEIFEIKDVDLYYGPKQVLKKVNLNLYKNKVTAFIGPSGCGKSTLLRCLNRMNDLIEGCKIEGQIKYRNENINDINPVMLRTKVGMVFQNPNPFPMSIFDNVAYGPRTHGIRKKSELDAIVEDSLKKAAIWDETKDRLKKSALGMSGGQQQRVAVARAIAAQPPIILADEPTGNLDSKSTIEIMNILKDLHESGRTVIIITHDDEIANQVDRVVRIMDGKIVSDSVNS